MTSTHPQSFPTSATNIVLRELQGVRRELAAVLEREDRTQQLVVRLDQHMEARFAELRGAIAEVRSDAVLQKNRRLSRHNEVLDILRRLDAAEMSGEPDPDS